MKRRKGRGVLGRVIIKDRGGDHHQHQQGKTKVYARHKPLEEVLLLGSSPLSASQLRRQRVFRKKTRVCQKTGASCVQQPLAVIS